MNFYKLNVIKNFVIYNLLYIFCVNNAVFRVVTYSIILIISWCIAGNEHNLS